MGSAGASDGGSPGVPPGRVQQVVDQLEGGVTSETCGISYHGGGATTKPLAEAWGRARKRQRRDDVSSRSTSHSQPSGREKATKGAGHRPRRRRSRLGRLRGVVLSTVLLGLQSVAAIRRPWWICRLAAGAHLRRIM